MNFRIFRYGIRGVTLLLLLSFVWPSFGALRYDRAALLQPETTTAAGNGGPRVVHAGVANGSFFQPNGIAFATDGPASVADRESHHKRRTQKGVVAVLAEFAPGGLGRRRRIVGALAMIRIASSGRNAASFEIRGDRADVAEQSLVDPSHRLALTRDRSTLSADPGLRRLRRRTNGDDLRGSALNNGDADRANQPAPMVSYGVAVIGSSRLADSLEPESGSSQTETGLVRAAFPRLRYVDFSGGPLLTNVAAGHGADVSPGSNADRGMIGLRQDQILLFEIDSRVSRAGVQTGIVRKGTDVALFNHWITGRPTAGNTDVEPNKNDQNYLIFVPSNLGQLYGPGALDDVSFFPMEPDLFAPGSEMAAYGRFALFDISNPTPTVRIVIDVSQTLRSDGTSRLPRFDVIGSEHVVVAPKGSGAMRLISPPLHPYAFHGHHLVAIQSDATEFTFAPQRSGFWGFFGQSTVVDPRHLVGFARDFSAVSPAVMARLRPPAELRSFPADLLKNRSLEYSGLYEDGWASDAVFVRLSRPAEARLRIRGSVPLVDDQEFKQRLIVRVGRSVVADRTLGVGDFDIDVPVKAKCAICDVRLDFGRDQHLPGPNPRPVSALLSSISF